VEQLVSDSKARSGDELRLKSGVSLAQTRFALSHFCLSNFGADGQQFVDLLEFCADTNLLQQALDAITAEVRGRYSNLLPDLIACVREANATNSDADAPARSPTPAATAASAAADVRPRSAAPTQKPRDAAEPLRLVAGVSLAQARFALSGFCLDHFGPQAQALLEAIDHCRDLGSLQKLLSQIAAEVERRRRDSLPKLIECVHEINETSL
jgi:hypothetical protein